MSRAPVTIALPCTDAILTGIKTTKSPATILLIHGRGGCIANMAYLQDALEALGVSTIGFDQVGNGGSTTNHPVTMSLYVETITEAVKLLQEREVLSTPCALYGASRGAYTALRAAINLQERCSSLVLCVPAFYADADMDVVVKPDESVVESIRIENINAVSNVATHLAKLSNNTTLAAFLAECDADIDNRVTNALLPPHAKKYLVDKAPHNLRSFFAEHPKALNSFVRSVAQASSCL